MTSLVMNLSPFPKHITLMKILKFLTPNTSTLRSNEIERLDRAVAKLEASMSRLEQTIKENDTLQTAH